MNFNKVILIGNLTRDVDLRVTPDGIPVATLGVATNRVWIDKTGKKQEEVEFHNVILWGRQAELAKQYLSKGRLVMIEGRLRTRSWDDKQTGQKRYRTEIIAERIQYGPRQNIAEDIKDQTEKTEDKIPEILDEIQLEEEQIPEVVQNEINDVPF